MSKNSSGNKRKLRSTVWFGSHDRDALVHRSWMKNRGVPHDQFDGRPVIGICNTYSELTPGNPHFPPPAGPGKAGAWGPGGFRPEFPGMPPGEPRPPPPPMLSPTPPGMAAEGPLPG